MKARIGLGTANFGMSYGLEKNSAMADPSPSNPACHALLNEAWTNGIRHLDTANHYGASESILQDYLLNNKDQEFDVCSKFYITEWEKEARESIARFGSRLKSLLWHNFDSGHELTGTFAEKFSALASKSPGPSLGCSTYGIQNATAAVSSGIFKTIEIEYNILNPHVYNSIAASARKNGITLVFRSILQKGFLTDKHLNSEFRHFQDDKKNSELKKIGKALRAVATAQGLKVENLALQYASCTVEDGILLIGANGPGQIITNCWNLKNASLSKSVLKEIDAIVAQTDPALLDLRTWQ